MLFGRAHESFYREPEGMVVAVFDAKPKRGGVGGGGGGFSVSISQGRQLIVVGRCPDYGTCKALRKVWCVGDVGGCGYGMFGCGMGCGCAWYVHFFMCIGVCVQCPRVQHAFVSGWSTMSHAGQHIPMPILRVSCCFTVQSNAAQGCTTICRQQPHHCISTRGESKQCRDDGDAFRDGEWGGWASCASCATYGVTGNPGCSTAMWIWVQWCTVCSVCVVYGCVLA